MDVRFSTRFFQDDTSIEAAGFYDGDGVYRVRFLPGWFRDTLPGLADRTFAVDNWTNPQVYNALGTGVTGLLTGQKTVDDVLKDMDAAWDS